MTNTCTVFFFENETPFAHDIIEYLQSPPLRPEDPQLEVRHHDHVLEAIRAIDQWTPDSHPHVALLDLHQPNYSEAGLEICKKINQNYPKLPIVFLSRHDAVSYKNRGLQTGAIEYLPKSLLNESDSKEHLRIILLNKIRYVEVIETHQPGSYEVGSLKINVRKSQVTWRNKSVDLNRTDLRILIDLTAPANERTTRTLLDLSRAANLTTRNKQQVENNVRKRIQCIRRAFADIDPDFKAAWMEGRHGILNAPSRGYRWKQEC